MIERHNPLLIFDVFFLYLAEQQRMTQVLAAGAKERERERKVCIYKSLLKTWSYVFWFLGR